MNKSLWPNNFESLEPKEKKEAAERVEYEIVAHILEDDFSDLTDKLEIGGKRIEIKIPRLEMAARFAEWIKLCINASKFLPSKTETNLVNVSHSFNLVVFLKEVMIFRDENGEKIKAKNMEAREFLDKIEGSIKPAEFFEIDVKREDKDNFTAFLKFRNKDYEIYFSRIEELDELAKQKRLEKSERNKN